nr:BMC domain-containing protein [Suicoccus acidiformans]
MSKERVIQEYVPGKQATLVHIIANPDEELKQKIGIHNRSHNAIGIMLITPSEAAIIAVDIAVKTAEVEIEYMDRFTGSLIISGTLDSVKAALSAAIQLLSDELHYDINPMSIS